MQKDKIPAGVYYSVDSDSFYLSADNRGMGMAFWQTWRNRKGEFPTMKEHSLTGCREIPLTQGAYAIIDEEDYSLVSAYKWHLNSQGYAKSDWWEGKDRFHVLMHRLIIQCPKGMIVDHINGNRLDNRKSNLRICTLLENARARRKAGGSSRYKGVSKLNKRWRAQIRADGVDRHLGVFATEEEAAMAYNVAAKILHGDFSVLNEVGHV